MDGILVKTFEDKQLEYELSLMGQQVGRHTAVVRLSELPLSEGSGGVCTCVCVCVYMVL